MKKPASDARQAGGLQTLQCAPGWVVALPAFLICLGLGVASLFVLADMQVEAFETEIPEMVRIARRNLPHAIVGALLLGGVLAGGAAALRSRISWRTARIAAFASAALNTILGFVWTSSFKSKPVADQEVFWNIAQTLAGKGELRSDQLEYLRYWPFQAASGMMAVPAAWLSNGEHLLWQVLSAVCAGGCVLLLCCICARMTDSPQAKTLCAVLLAGFVPLPMYTTFVYGTLPGMLLALLGIYAVIRQCQPTAHERRWWGVAAAAFALSVTLYTGEQIFLAAGVLVLLAVGLFDKTQRRKLLAAVLLAAVALAFSKGAQAAALYALGMENEPGTPILTRIAMGVNSHSEVTPGFYNGDSIVLYYMADYQPDKANELAANFIKGCLNELKTEKRMLAFFGEKTADQWLEPWFGGLTMNNPAVYNEPNALARSITGGTLFRVLHRWLSTLLPVIYLGAAAGIAALRRRHPREVWRLSLAAALIGGFLFQLMAEAKPRYCMPYYLGCFPLAAAGLAALGEALAKRKNGKNAVK